MCGLLGQGMEERIAAGQRVRGPTRCPALQNHELLPVGPIQTRLKHSLRFVRGDHPAHNNLVVQRIPVTELHRSISGEYLRQHAEWMLRTLEARPGWLRLG